MTNYEIDISVLPDKLEPFLANVLRIMDNMPKPSRYDIEEIELSIGLKRKRLHGLHGGWRTRSY